MTCHQNPGPGYKASSNKVINKNFTVSFKVEAWRLIQYENINKDFTEWQLSYKILEFTLTFKISSILSEYF